MAVRDWTQGQIAVVWGTLILISIWVAVVLYLVAAGASGWQEWVQIWVLVLGLVGLPGLGLTWRWMGRGALEPHAVGMSGPEGSPAKDRDDQKGRRASWFVGLAITAIAALNAATGDPEATAGLIGGVLGYLIVTFLVAWLFLGWSPRTRPHVPIGMALIAILVSYGQGFREQVPPVSPTPAGTAIDGSASRDPRIERARQRLQARSDSLATDTTKRPGRP